MGEELFAAGPYLSKDSVVHGSIKAQDTVKAILMALILVGMITYSFGWDITKSLFLSA